MTKRLDLGPVIAGASAIVIVGAVIAGLIVVGNPADERAERIDALQLSAMGQIAAAAQCAYTYTGEVPADLAAIETALRERRRALPACDHVAFELSGAEAIDYAPKPPDQIELCGDFQRPSPVAAGQNASLRPDLGVVVAGTDFPELRETRESSGRHCYRVRLVDQAVTADQ